jgi:hypothetical protein
VNIHNQCSDFNLEYLGCFSSGADWSEEPDKEVDTGNTMCVDFKSSLATLEGVLAYKLQRKYKETDNQSELIHTLLFIAWKSEGYKKFRVYTQLTECDKTFCWNNFRLREYYQRYVNQLNTYTVSSKNTWLIHDGTILMTGLELNFAQRDGVLNITISEGIKDEHTKRPIWINPRM